MGTSPRRLALLLLPLAAAISAAPRSASAVDPPAGALRGLWVWRADSIDTPEARRQLIGFATKHGFNRLLVQIHYGPTPGRAGEIELSQPGELGALLTAAAAAAVVVEALDGAPGMARPANRPASLARLDAVLAFNRTRPAGQRLAGIHYDIEPYLLPEWNTPARDTVMREYLEFLALARRRVEAESPRPLLAADIPMWYDAKTEPPDTCAVAFGGVTKNLHAHVQDLTDYVGIMSYRRRATGEDSVVAHVETELAYAEQIGKSVCAALETVELRDTPHITFFGQDPAAFWETKRQVEQALSPRKGFGGVLVHSYEGIRALVERTP